MVVTIELREEDALVLFELLGRHADEVRNADGEPTSLRFEDIAEHWALSAVYGRLECTLVEPFDPEYDALVAAARRAVRVRVGVENPLHEA
jgi:hypothetical protein